MKTIVLSIVLLAGLGLASCSSSKQDTTTKEEPNEIHMVGGYTNHRELTKEDKTLFNETYKAEPELTPLKVATQVVAGTNYSFICKDKQGNEYEVVIFQALPCNGGKAEVTSVKAKH